MNHFFINNHLLPVMGLCVLSWTGMACKGGVPAPELTGIAPESQFEEEGVRVAISGSGFHPKVQSRAGEDQEFVVDDTFAVRFIPSVVGEGEPFVLASVQRLTESELVGVTPDNAEPGLYSIMVESPFGVESAPLEDLFVVLSDGDNDPSSGDTETTSDPDNTDDNDDTEDKNS